MLHNELDTGYVAQQVSRMIILANRSVSRGIPSLFRPAMATGSLGKFGWITVGQPGKASAGRGPIGRWRRLASPHARADR
jgi:hypothetical protein